MINYPKNRREGHRWTEEELDILRDNYPEKRINELFYLFNEKISEYSIKNKLSALGIIDERLSSWKEEDLEIMNKYYGSVDNKKIKELLNDKFPVRSIINKAYKMGVGKDYINKIDKNVNYFDEFSNDMAYILGLILTDGSLCNNGISITLHEQDKYLLEKISFAIGMDGKGIRKVKNSNCNTLSMSSVVMRKSMDIYGITNNKSFTARFPYNVPDKFYPDILRGIFDGDGSICFNETSNKRSVTITTASHEFANDLVSILIKYGVSAKIYDKKSSADNIIKVVTVAKTSDILLLRDLFYYDGVGLHLTRKREKFDKIFDKISMSTSENFYIVKKGWSKEEEKIVIDNFANSTIGEMVLLLNGKHTPASISYRAGRLGVIRNHDTLVRIVKD